MFTYSYINKLQQFDEISYSLIIENNESDPPLYFRIEKTFKISENELTEEILEAVALNEIAIIEENLSISLDPSDPPVEK